MDYDPVNATSAGRDHLRAGEGRDPDDAAPVRGVLRSAGAQVSLQRVDVVPLDG